MKNGACVMDGDKNYSVDAGGLKLPTEDALFRMLKERSDRKRAESTEKCEDGYHCQCFYETDYEFWCCFCDEHNGKPPPPEDDDD